jgi:fructokinase
LRLGIDLGGTKIEIVALADDSAELLRRRAPTSRGDYPGTLSAVAGLIEQAENQLGLRGSVGIGIPGAESRLTGVPRQNPVRCPNGGVRASAD